MFFLGTIAIDEKNSNCYFDFYSWNLFVSNNENKYKYNPHTFNISNNSSLQLKIFKEKTTRLLTSA